MKKEVMLGFLVACEKALATIKSVKDLSGADIMGIRRTIKPMLGEIEEYHTLRNEMITKLGKPDEKGNPSIRSTEPNFAVFQKWVNDVTTSMVTVKLKHQLKIEEIAQLKPCPLSDNDIDMLVELGILIETPEIEEKEETVTSLRDRLSQFSPKSDVEETPSILVDDKQDLPEVIGVNDITTELPKTEDIVDGEITEDLPA